MINKIIHGDNLQVLKLYPDNFFHSVVTDPPYGLKFMNKHWDYDVPQVEFWQEVLRVLKPGGYVLSFGGTRTYHRMVVNIEDAGFIIRDQLQWIYGQGFPKSLNLGKSVNQLETNEWSKIATALDNISVNDYIDVWKNSLKSAKVAEIQSQRKQITAGQDIQKESFVVLNVAQDSNQENLNVLVSFAKQNLREAQATGAKINIARGDVEAEIKQLQDPVKFAEQLSKSQNPRCLNIFTAEFDVKEWLKENTEINHRVEEALKTLRGDKKYSSKEIINVLIAVVPSVLKHIILNQSKTFRSLDTIQKMECVSAMNAIITEFIMVNLITNTVAILKSKAVDKLQGNEREETGELESAGFIRAGRTDAEIWLSGNPIISTRNKTQGSSEWEGYGTALKPANEPICLAMKPLSEKNFAENVLKHGAGGLNIDGCRVGESGARFNGRNVDSDIYGKYGTAKLKEDYGKGRFPSNVILDEEAGGMLNGEARFFYCSKASSSERNAGMRWDSERGHIYPQNNSVERKELNATACERVKNHHATVKPLSLMRYLVRLVTPKGGIVLEPFAGSGTTLLAAKKEGFEFVGIERELEYCKIAEQRLESVAINEKLF